MKKLATPLQVAGLICGVAAGACVSLFWALVVASVGLIVSGVALELPPRKPGA